MAIHKKTNVISLNTQDAEQVWTRNVIDFILLLCPFNDCRIEFKT